MRKKCSAGLIFVLVLAVLVLPGRVSAAPATPWPAHEGDEYGRRLSPVARGPLSLPSQVWSYTPPDCVDASRIVVAQDGSLYLLYARKAPSESVRRICLDKLSKYGSRLWTVDLASGYNDAARTKPGDLVLLDDGGVAVLYAVRDPADDYHGSVRFKQVAPGGSVTWEQDVADFTREDSVDGLKLVRDASYPARAYALHNQAGTAFKSYRYCLDLYGRVVSWRHEYRTVGHYGAVASPGGSLVVLNRTYSGKGWLAKYLLNPYYDDIYYWYSWETPRVDGDERDLYLAGPEGSVYVGYLGYYSRTGTIDVHNSSNGNYTTSFGGSGSPSMSGTWDLAQGPDGSLYRLGYSSEGNGVYRLYLQRFGPAPGYALQWSAALGSVYVSYGSPPNDSRVVVDAEGNAFVKQGSASKLYGISPGGQILWTLSTGAELLGMGGDGRLYCKSGGTFLAYNTQDGLPAPTGLAVAASGGLAWHPSAGRGYVTLSWNAVRGATGYKVHVFDGYAYREFDAGSARTWDSRVARIYPSEEQLASYPDNAVTSDLFNHVQGGLDLRDDPRGLYRKTAGTTYDDRTNYWFRVSAYNPWAYGVMSEAVTPTLPNRTDARAPEGSVAVNGGAEYVNQTQVTVNFAVTDPPVPNHTSDGSDDASGLSQVRFSNDNSYWSAWEPYAAAKQWTLSAGDGSKTVYVQVKDNAGNVGFFQDSIVLDTNAPTGSVVVNSGAQYATAQGVALSLSATDSLSGVSEMRFSNDGSSWSGWEAYAASRVWSLSPGDGAKTVYAQFRDRAGNASVAVSDAIVLDATAPSANPQVNGGAAYTNSVSATVAINGYDATSGLLEMMVSARSDFAGASWEGYQATRSLILPPGDGTKTVYVKLKDRAGNVSGVFSDAIVLDTASPSGSLRVLSRDGLAKTASQEVVLEISASDSLSGVRGIQLSNNGVAWTDEMPLSSPVDWVLSPGAGTKTVYLKVWDRAGNSSLASGEIVLVDDMLGPQVTLQVEGGAQVVSRLAVDLGILAWDNFSRPEEMRMRFSSDGLHWSVWEPYAESKQGWDLSAAAYGGSSEQGTKRVYCQVVDANANIGQGMAQVYYAASPVPGYLESSDGVAGTYAGSPCRYVRSNQVTVHLVPEAKEVQFSLDGVVWGPWEPYAPYRRVTLPKGDGPTVVSARFRDAEGAVSPVAEIVFVLDASAPQVAAKALGGATVTKTGSVTLVVAARDNVPGPLECRLDGGEWALLPADGKVVKSGLDPGASGRLYSILVEVRDQAGNVGSAMVDIWSLP